MKKASSAAPRTFQPYTAPQSGLKEFTFRSLLVGCILGVVFGAANAYLGLRVGLTISTSIPISVLTVLSFFMLPPFRKLGSILEANISQTVGSASSSLASGMIFTIPALYLWGQRPSLSQLVMISFVGGILGVCFMVPLRRFLIQEEHDTLPYPEATACAEVLMAADRGGQESMPIFKGLLAGGVLKFLGSALGLWKSDFAWNVPWIRKGQLSLEASPALLGVGYILGLRVATVMVGGSLLAWMVINPMIAWWGAERLTPFFPETAKLISEMSPGELWSRYVRYIGAGAVACGGILSLIKSIPTIASSLRYGLSKLRSSVNSSSDDRLNTDLSYRYIGALLGLCVLLLAFTPFVLGFLPTVWAKIFSALLLVGFAFIFVTVSSRIVGMVGVTSNPTSGMTIGTLLGVSGLFFLLGWRGPEAMAQALCIGAVVATAASIAGDMSQDLKCGYLLGATPWKQQLGQVLGVATSMVFVCLTLVALEKAYGFGSKELPAPQANLMKVVIEGVLTQNLPWNLVLMGVGLALVAQALRLPVLAFAVGVYLPLATMMPVFVGGVVRWWIERTSKQSGENAPKERGVLFSSGLVGGEGLVGVAVAIFALILGRKPEGMGHAWAGVFEEFMPLLIAAVLIGLLLRSTRDPAKSS